jgi:hypothetical protein
MTMNDPRRRFRVKPSYQKPAGGFLAIGPRYEVKLLENRTAVRFEHPEMPTWTETVSGCSSA